jgi:hypothetical protein
LALLVRRIRGGVSAVSFEWRGITVADQKSRGGKKAASEKQPRGKKRQGTMATGRKGKAPQAQREVPGRQSRRQKV